MEQLSSPTHNVFESAQMYGGIVLASLAERVDDLPTYEMPGPPTSFGTRITTEGKTGPDKNGQYTQDTDSDSNIDIDPSE